MGIGMFFPATASSVSDLCEGVYVGCEEVGGEAEVAGGLGEDGGEWAGQLVSLRSGDVDEGVAETPARSLPVSQKEGRRRLSILRRRQTYASVRQGWITWMSYQEGEEQAVRSCYYSGNGIRHPKVNYWAVNKREWLTQKAVPSVAAQSKHSDPPLSPGCAEFPFPQASGRVQFED